MKAGNNKDILTMKRTFLYILGALFIMSSCVEENFKGNFSKAEGEVSFRASVSKTPATKTVYGNLNEDGSKQEVFWTHNDQITVFGANCYIPQADYAVSVSSVDAEGNTVINKTQNYASALNKTGSYGVQWGNVAQTDFYAVYPATSGTFEADVTEVTEKTTEDGETVNVVTTSKATITTNISTTQNVYFTQTVVGQNADGSNKLGWKGVHYSDDIHNPSANGALMYACTSAATTDKEQVDLQFHPFSTVLRFNFEGFRVVADTDNPNIPDYSASVYVEQIKLTAPTDTGVAGNFSLTINNNGTETSSPTAAATKGDSDVITIVPSDYIPLATHETLEFDVFTIPQNYTMSENALWTVTLETTGGDYTYKMIPKVVNNDVATSTTATLAAGKIHNLGIPMLTVEKSQAVDIPDDSWIAYIPRNVYLSELSMPGAWYAVDANYQGSSANLTSLYEKGVRAFHIDCRVSYDSVTKPELSNDHTYSETMSLVCCGTEKSESEVGLITSLTYTQGETVKSKIEELMALIKSHPQEYVMVVLTIAEKPKTHDYGTGDYVFGTVEPSVVLSYIKTMIDELRNTENPAYIKSTDNGENIPIIYNKPITTNTTVNDVLGHIVIKINTNSKAESFTKYNNIPNTLISFASMASDSDYISGDIVGSNTISNLFTEMQTSNLYWGGDQIVDSENMAYYYHQAQLTTSSTTEASTSTTPSLYDRTLAVENIIDQSAEIYSGNSHNALFQLGVGGYIHHDSLIANRDYNSQAEVAAHLNTKILNAINEKLTTEPSPIGIVLMNFAYYDSIKPSDNGGSTYDTDTYQTNGLKLTQAILEMNKKFFLNRNPEAEEWPNGNPFEQTANPSAQQLSVAHITVTEEAF